jgi:hypothetical protein
MRRLKKYDAAHSKLVRVDGTNASARSLMERWAMIADERLVAKPAWLTP